MKNLKIINLLFLFLSFMLYFFSPKEYNYNFCLFINIAFSVQNILYFSISKRNLVSFEFFFMLAFYGVNFIYPVFYFPTNPTFSVFEYAFKYEIISKATAVAFLAYTCYMFGLTIRLKINEDEDFKFDSTDFSDNFFKKALLLFSILSISYISSVGMDFFRGYEWYVNEDNKTPLTSFMDFSGAILTMFIFFIPNLFTRIKYLFLIVSFIVVYLLSGSRNMPLSLLLILVLTFNDRIKKIPTSVFIAIICIGLFVLTFVALARGEGFSDSSAISNGLSTAKENSFFDFAADLVINNRNLYVLVDFADTHGVTYGVTMLAGVLGLIPYLGTYVSNSFGIPLDLMSTPGFNTYLEFGHGSDYGLGGNMVADVYLSFGLLGVIIAFFIFGFFISKLIQNYKSKIHYYIMYCLLVSNSIFINRESYLLPLRGVVYCLFMFWILNHFLLNIRANKH